MLKVESKYTKKYLFAILFFIIMSIICVTIFLTNINSGINEKVQEILLNEVISHRKSLEATISIQYQELEGISEYITSLNTRDMSQLINFTKAFVSKNGFDRIVVAFEDGIGYLSDGSSYDISTRGYYQDTMNGGARNSEPVDSVIDGERRMALSVPIYSQHGQIIGMVMGSYDVRAISEIEFSNLYNNKGYTYLIDYSGNFLINDQKLHNYQGNFYDYCQESNILSNQQLQQIKTDISNYVSGCVLTKGGKETRYLVYVPLESSEWVICYSVLVSDAFQDYQFIMKYETYLLGAVAMVLTVTVLYIFIVNKKERRVLLKRADYDSLTGLYNRRKLTEEIKRYLKAQSEFGLAILDIDDFKFEFKKMNKSGALFDVNKLMNISKTYISHLKANDLYNRVSKYLLEYDKEFYNVFTKDEVYSTNILNIEREVKKPRKDIGKYSDVFNEINYMYDEYFKPIYEETNLNADMYLEYISSVFNSNDDKNTWFNNLSEFAAKYNYAQMKDYKENPDNYVGHIGDFCEGLRYIISGRRQTPDLYEITKLLGKERLLSRINNYKKDQM